MLDRDVLTFDVTQLAQPLSKCFVEERRDVAQKPDPGGLSRRLLGRGGERRGQENEGKSGGGEMHDPTDR